MRCCTPDGQDKRNKSTIQNSADDCLLGEGSDSTQASSKFGPHNKDMTDTDHINQDLYGQEGCFNIPKGEKYSKPAGAFGPSRQPIDSAMVEESQPYLSATTSLDDIPLPCSTCVGLWPAERDSPRLSRGFDASSMIQSTTTPQIADIPYSEVVICGRDNGHWDADIPMKSSDRNFPVQDFSPSGERVFSINKNFVVTNEIRRVILPMPTRPRLEHGRYYRATLLGVTPIDMEIPRAYLPLPDLLSAKPMNLLYFHHFINNTARILVAHDCDSNPFRTLLSASK